MPCKRCKERGKTWNGDDAVCAFDGEFADNWNCATLNAIRDICHESQSPMPSGVDYQYCEDQKYATVKIYGIDDVNGLALWVSWYKNRGRTDAMWILDEDFEPRRPTEQELDAIIRHYSR